MIHDLRFYLKSKIVNLNFLKIESVESVVSF